MDLLERLQVLQCSFLSIGHPNLDANLSALLISQGITIMGWTPDDTRNMKRLAAMSPEIMICTNRPDLWVNTFL
ncbi:glycerophosphoryl diester phosphodiesterase [Paenibacillus pini JCM 16418]|uniref:Glycerophosphoryl diester phosphodiesterase n=1 Tax=Paenibacillus pini JCM 16418 TaxID=1236976 RepID=W7YP62_9BACL|nr:glycerophosphoryl diester phosphodiesterase [Paenibacillus pini JCM 16418]